MSTVQSPFSLLGAKYGKLYIRRPCLLSEPDKLPESLAAILPPKTKLNFVTSPGPRAYSVVFLGYSEFPGINILYAKNLYSANSQEPNPSTEPIFWPINGIGSIAKTLATIAPTSKIASIIFASTCNENPPIRSKPARRFFMIAEPFVLVITLAPKSCDLL